MPYSKLLERLVVYIIITISSHTTSNGVKKQIVEKLPENVLLLQISANIRFSARFIRPLMIILHNIILKHII